MRILALDLGTKTGWASFDNGFILSGSQELATRKELKAQKQAKLDRCCDLRLGRLNELVESELPVDEIWFEDVTFCSTQYQAQLWASLRAVLVLRHPGIKVACLPVMTLKKFAGHGGADKDGMARLLMKKHPERYARPPTGVPSWAVCQNRVTWRLLDDNEVDALHLLDYALYEHHLQA